MRAAILLTLAAWLPMAATAQDEYEYRCEIGGAAGLTSYLGDFNGSLTKGMQPTASILFRRVVSPYSAIRADLSLAQIKGGSKDAASYYPALAGETYSFKRTLTDLNLAYELNFWPYGTGRDYRGAVRLTPYIFAGIGATLATGKPADVLTANVPVGVGVKYKAGKRLNIAIEWAAHFALSDRLDGLADPYGIKSSGMFKNTDGYSRLRLSLTYSFSPKCRTCNKDE